MQVAAKLDLVRLHFPVKPLGSVSVLGHKASGIFGGGSGDLSRLGPAVDEKLLGVASEHTMADRDRLAFTEIPSATIASKNADHVFAGHDRVGIAVFGQLAVSPNPMIRVDGSVSRYSRSACRAADGEMMCIQHMSIWTLANSFACAMASRRKGQEEWNRSNCTSGKSKEGVGQMQWVGVFDHVVRNLVSGVDLHGQLMLLHEADNASKQIILEVAGGQVRHLVELVRHRLVRRGRQRRIARDFFEVALGVCAADLAGRKAAAGTPAWS